MFTTDLGIKAGRSAKQLVRINNIFANMDGIMIVLSGQERKQYMRRIRRGIEMNIDSMFKWMWVWMAFVAVFGVAIAIFVLWLLYKVVIHFVG